MAAQRITKTVANRLATPSADQALSNIDRRTTAFDVMPLGASPSLPSRQRARIEWRRTSAIGRHPQGRSAAHWDLATASDPMCSRC